jgi:4-amino-4-deoxy-L-arabinose transferase-like glycosyltransferase
VPGAATADHAGPRRLLLLALVGLLGLAPLLAGLEAAPVADWMETVALGSSREMWLAGRAGQPDAWLVPTWNGELRFHKPPLLLWLHLAAWAGLDPEVDPVDRLVGRARLLAAGFGLVTLAAVAWLGTTLGGFRLGLSAMLIAASMPLFQRQFRLASYDSHLTAWVGLAVAAAAWAIAPLAPAPRAGRRVVGFGVAGVALGLAGLTKGPVAVLFVLPPLAAVIALADERRRAHLLGTAAAFVAAAAVAAPWYAYALDRYLTAGTLRDEYLAPLGQGASYPHYYLDWLSKLSAPWTIWLALGLVLPLLPGFAAGRRRRLLPWLWAVAVVGGASLVPPKQLRYVMPALPAIALVAAHGWAAGAGGARPALGRWLSRAHWAALALVALTGGAFFAFEPALLARGWVAAPSIRPIGWPVAAGLTAALLGGCALGWRWHEDGRTERALAVTFGLAILMATVYWHGAATAPSPRATVRDDARRVARLVGGAPLYLLDAGTTRALGTAVILYARRPVPSVSPAELRALAATGACVYVIADVEAALSAAAFTPVTEFRDYPERRRARPPNRRLWARDCPSPTGR